MEGVACFERGSTAHSMKDYHAYLAEIEKYKKKTEKEVKRAMLEIRKVSNVRKRVRLKGNVKIRARM